jgi:cobalamin synthase
VTTKTTREQAYRSGIVVGLIIAVLTAIEFWAALQTFAFVGVLLCAVAKTVLILRRYMHIDLLWNEGSHH